MGERRESGAHEDKGRRGVRGAGGAGGPGRRGTKGAGGVVEGETGRFGGRFRMGVERVRGVCVLVCGVIG